MDGTPRTGILGEDGRARPGAGRSNEKGNRWAFKVGQRRPSCCRRLHAVIQLRAMMSRVHRQATPSSEEKHPM
jgi:hypothetical protein